MKKAFDILAFIGSLSLAWAVHHDPSLYEQWLTSGVLVFGGLTILTRDIEDWGRYTHE